MAAIKPAGSPVDFFYKLAYKEIAPLFATGLIDDIIVRLIT